MAGDDNDLSEKQKHRLKDFSLIPKILNGGIAGIIGVTCVYPLDLVKTRLQNQQPLPDGTLMYKNMFDCFRKTYKAEGFLGMYHGSAVNILLITPEKAIKLTGNDYFRHMLTDKNGNLPVYCQMLAGGLAGAFQIIVTTPMELLKIQLQDAGRTAGSGEKLTTKKVIFDLFKERGVFGFYKGLKATAIRDISFSMLYFPLFAELNDMGPRRKDGEAVTWFSAVSGLFAGAFSAWLVTPLDVIKTRLQLIQKGRGEKEFSGYIDCIKQTFKNEGAQAFFKGGLCRAMVLAPLFGIAQAVYYLMIGERIVAKIKKE